MNTQYIDLVLNNSTGGTVSIFEVKSYPKVSPNIQNEVFDQLNSYAKNLDQNTLRYITLLSTSNGYIKDLKTNKEIEFDTRPIIKDYLKEDANKDVSPRLLNSVFFSWLRDLSLGLREKMTEPENKLNTFGFIKNIRNTLPQMEFPLSK